MTYLGQMPPQRHRGGLAGASPQFTTAAPGTGAIVDTHNNTWTVTSTGPTQGRASGQIAVNGVVDTVTGSVWELVYQGGRIWQYTPFGWYFKVLTTNTWTFDPGPGSVTGTIVNIGDAAAIIDASAYVWQITAGGQIMVNGVVDITTGSVTQLEYFGGQIWQNTAFGWYFKTVPSDAWVASANGPGVVTAGSRSVILGAHLGDGGFMNSGPSDNFAGFVAAMNEAPPLILVYDYPDLGADYLDPAKWTATTNWASFGANNFSALPNAVTVTSVCAGIPIAAETQSNRDQNFTDILNGKWDNNFKAIYDSYVANGFKLIFSRPGWEMNGDWEPWSWQYSEWNQTHAQKYAAVFKYIAEQTRAYVAAHSGIDIQMVWNPGYLPGGAGPDYHDLYPGDAYVDHVGIDTYGPFSDGSGGSPSNSPLFVAPVGNNQYFSLDDAIKFCIAHDKPLCFPETGVSPGETVFQNDLQAKVTQNPTCKVSFVAIWNKTDGNGPNSLWSTNTASGVAWKACFNAIRSTNAKW